MNDCDDCDLRGARARVDHTPYPWDDCIADQLKRGESQKSAEAICGSIKAKYSDAAIVLRYDVAKLGAVTRLPAGGIRVDANIARTGIQSYSRHDGTTRREYRPPTEVFAADSLASLGCAPVTRGHPGEVTPANWRSVAVGTVSEAPPRRDTIGDADFVVAPLLVHDAATIAAIDRGDLAEVSAGYAAVIDETPGVTPQGERYDAIQRGVKFNHVALLPPGCARAGRAAKLRLDGNQDMLANIVPRGEDMPEQIVKIRLDGVEYVEGSKEHVGALVARLDAADKAAVDAKAQAEKANAEACAKADALNAEIAKLRADSSDAAIEARAVARDAFRVRAAKILGREYKFDGKPELAVKRDALAKLGVEVRADATEQWIGAYFDARVDALPKGFDYNTVTRSDAAPIVNPHDHQTRADASRDAFQKLLDGAFDVTVEAPQNVMQRVIR